MFHRIMYGMFFLLLAIQVFANPVPSNSEYVKDVTLAGRGSYFKNIVPLRTDGKKVIIPNCAQDCFNLGRHALRCPKDDYTCGCNEKKYSKLSELSIKCVESNCNVGPGANVLFPKKELHCHDIASPVKKLKRRDQDISLHDQVAAPEQDISLVTSTVPNTFMSSNYVTTVGSRLESPNSVDPSTVFRRRTRDGLLCWAQNFPPAHATVLFGLMAEIRRLGPGQCGAGAGNCTRWCRNGSAIDLCNDNPDRVVRPSCLLISNYAQEIYNNCRRPIWQDMEIQGQEFDDDRWNVIIRGVRC